VKALAVNFRFICVKNSVFILATIPVFPAYVDADVKEGFVTFQTFSLDDGYRLLIKFVPHVTSGYFAPAACMVAAKHSGAQT